MITIILDTLSEEHFTSFLDERVRLMHAPGAVGVFDNAATIHHSLGSRLMLEDVLTNLYYFLPVYSLIEHLACLVLEAHVLTRGNFQLYFVNHEAFLLGLNEM